ncbi:MAG TPA: hypothetical protein VGR94_08645 [Candidatus Acidoferrales bacterium]|nr:hypothetical protein [Candidatus Acidoferrales bacterium]
MEFSGGKFEGFDGELIDIVSDEPQKPLKGGRPTIPDDLLLDSRNQWQPFFGQCWPEIDWPLSQIRKRRKSTIKDVQRVFEEVRHKPLCDHAKIFLRGEPQRTTVEVLRKQTKASSKLRYEVQDMQNKRPELQRLCLEAANALSQASEAENATIQAELVRRIHAVKEHEGRFDAKERECIALEKQVRDGEVYLYCSELLDFLRSKGKRKRAMTPTNLANALAGLPYMRWRQSEARCSKMPANSFKPYPYAVFQLIKRLLRRTGAKRGKSLLGAFRAELLKLPKKENYPRDSICEQWRDFRLAIEEVSKSKHQSGFIPNAITSEFLRNVSRQKTSVDNVLDAQEKLGLNAR